MSKSIFSAPHFNDEAAAYAFVEAHLWPEGPVCPHCGGIAKAGRLQGKSNRPGLWKCYACRKPFTVKVGTIFEASHIQMRDWLTAMHLICSSKKGISSNQLSRTLGLTLKSAWFMSHRIREAMDPSGPDSILNKLGGDFRHVEADETEIGKSKKTKGTRKRRDNLKVLSLVERGGRVRSFRIDNANLATIKPLMHANLRKDTRLNTDMGPHWLSKKLGFPHHEMIDHSKEEYARRTPSGDKVTTNSAEGYFSIFKRGLVGTYQHMSSQHLQRYLNEFDFRMSNRARLGVDDEERSVKALKGVVGKRLTYRTPGRQTV
jgi:transposase-like protein